MLSTHFSQDHMLRFIDELNKAGRLRDDTRQNHVRRVRDEFYHSPIIMCSMCGDEIVEKVFFSFYSRPYLFLHISCSELPQVITHIFHPQHRLIQTDISSHSRKRYMLSIFDYSCDTCYFSLDVKRATLVPVEDLIIKNKKLSHPHPLIVCKQTQNFEIECGGCKQSLDKREEWDHIPSPIYACRECDLLLDESCAVLPQQITHHFHPQHPLDLFCSKYWDSHGLICSACGQGTRFGYKCSDSECNFQLDAPCASLMHTLLSVSAAGDDHQQDVYQNIRRHPHPLIICDIRRAKNFGRSRSCFGCQLPLINYALFCGTCKVLFHETCTKLPYQIQHPSHPLHPLTLQDSVDYIRGRFLSPFTCNLCMSSSCKCFAYRCHPCDFDIELRCALRSTAYPMIKSQLHDHSLVYSNCTPSGREYIRCTKCSVKLEYPFFHCYQCQFGLHAHCLSDSDLPPIIKHKCHLHPLTLTYSLIKDRPEEDENAELYCDVCEEQRLLRDPTYYCQECHYVAHIHCLIFEVISYLQERETAAKELNKLKLDALATNDVCADSEKVDEVGAGKVDEQIVTQDSDSVLLAKVEDEIAALTTNIATLSTEVATLSTKLSDAKEKRAQLIASTLGASDLRTLTENCGRGSDWRHRKRLLKQRKRLQQELTTRDFV